MQLQCVNMTAQVEDKANDLGLHDEKTLKSNKTMRHSPDIDSYIPARHSSLSEVVTLTPQSLSPRTNSSTGPLHGSFHEIDDLPKDHSSSRDDSFGSPRVELVPEQGDRSATHSPKAESTAEAKQNTGYVEHEPSKKRRVDEHDDSAEVEAYEELRKNAFAALQYIEQDFAKLRQRLYHERISELDREVKAIASGRHPEYAVAMADIDRRRKKQLKEASEWRRHKSNDIHRQVQSSQRLAQVQFLAKRAELRRSIVDDIVKKRQKIRDEMLVHHNEANIPSESTLKQYREMTVNQNKEVIGISSAVGFPISIKPIGLDQAEIESDVRMIQQLQPNDKSRISYIT